MKNIFLNKYEKKSCSWIVVLGCIILSFSWEIIVFIMIITHTGGKLKNYDEISEYVINNQDTFEETAIYMLSQWDNIDISVKKNNLNSFKDSKDVKDLFNENNIRNIRIYKNKNIQIVVFQTYVSGLGGDESVRGFIYFTGDNEDEILQHKYFSHYSVEIEEIMDSWFYYKLTNY